MTFIPHNDYVMCVLDDQNASTQTDSIFVFEAAPALPVYRIINNGKQTQYSVGDKVITNSTPTKAKSDKGEVFFINTSNIIGRV